MQFINSTRSKKVKDLTETDKEILFKIIDQWNAALCHAWQEHAIDTKEELYFHKMRSQI